MTASNCCGVKNAAKARFLTGGFVKTPEGDVPAVSTEYTLRDRLGAWKVRWGMGRMDYKVEPGLYCVGQPDEQSPLLVSANYKMSFDCLRRALAGSDAWILVIDTGGVNVWCAAGKGTFGTSNLLRSMARLRVDRVVSHKVVVVPQLAASGVSAREVREKIGFKVVFGPVRATDLPEFLKNGMKATSEMRRVRFTLKDRAAVVPIEVVQSARVTLTTLGVLFLLNILGMGRFTPENVTPYLLAVIAGTVVVPLALPLIPFRSFALKGAFVGTVLALLCYGVFRTGASWREATAGFLLLPAIAAHFALHFTGSTTLTSRSGVRKELKFALPLQMAGVLGSLAILLTGVFA